jgi:glycine/D-amino acid oxidase-like deaminating enzyme
VDIDYLIIGQGLAGSLLAWELIHRHKKIIIIDNNKENASLVAAGLINPITGMRFVKNANIDYLLPSAINYYQQLSLFFQQTFYVEKSMLRIIRNPKELIACQKRFSQSDYQAYLSQTITSRTEINAESGLLQQKQTGYLLTRPLLSALKDYFISINAYINSSAAYDDIQLTPQLQWQHIKPKQIIFCEGYQAINNPWFSWLPFQPVKGEIMTAQSSRKIMDSILNYGHWFIPLDSYQFRTGATFDRDTLDTKITPTAKETLFRSLHHVYPSLTADKIIDHQAGIRPTTLDKNPFMGTHPQHRELVFFNGFGAKGSLQIPWNCQHLADHLINKVPVLPSNNILRYTLSP